jgi:hypothetical protein
MQYGQGEPVIPATTGAKEHIIPRIDATTEFPDSTHKSL